ncbi:MAG: hypothetical protein MJ124_09155, partial [Lachnospiraceae bacterium]|nr:hypothetical protein [Lachnospiraceae bacterium]
QAMERGNIKENGESVFSKNLEVLREEMLNSSYDAINRRFIFSGWALVALAPAFVLNWFKVKGIEFEETLRSFYIQYGPFIVAFGLLATVLVYRLINRTRDIYERVDDFDDGHIYKRIGEKIKADNIVRSVPGKYKATVETMLKRTGSNMPVQVFYMKMLIWSVIGVLVVSSLIFYVHATEKHEYLKEIHNFDTRISAIQKQKPNIEKVILEIVNEYKDTDMETIGDEVLLLEVESRIRLPNKDLKASMITVIREQIEGYQTEGLKWYDILIALSGLIAGLYWYIELAYYDNECMNARKQEVREFQLVIVLEKSFKTATVYSILNEMTSHAILYKDKLQKALLMYSESRERTYEYLKDDDNMSFRILIDRLQAVDSIGVAEAFAEVESNIRTDQRIEKLQDEMAFSKKKETLEIFIYIPAVIFIGVYFILPFLLSSLEGVNEVFKEMGRM